MKKEMVKNYDCKLLFMVITVCVPGRLCMSIIRLARQNISVHQLIMPKESSEGTLGS